MQPVETSSSYLYSILNVLFPYLSYEGFGQLQMLNKSFLEKLTEISNSQYAWIMRIKQELNLDITDHAKNTRDWKLSYKALHELDVSKETMLDIEEKRLEEQRKKYPIFYFGCEDLINVILRTKEFLLGEEHHITEVPDLHELCSYRRDTCLAALSLAAKMNCKHTVKVVLGYIEQDPEIKVCHTTHYELQQAVEYGSIDVIRLILKSRIPLTVHSYSVALRSGISNYNEEILSILLSDYVSKFPRDQDVVLLRSIIIGESKEGDSNAEITRFVLRNPQIRESITNEKLWAIIDNYGIRNGKFNDALIKFGYDRPSE